MNKQLRKFAVLGLPIGAALLLAHGTAHAAGGFVYPGTMCQGTSSSLGYSGPERTHSAYGDSVLVTCPVPRHDDDFYGYSVTVYARDKNWDEDIQCELQSYTINGDLYRTDFASSTGHTGNVEPFNAAVHTMDGPVVLRCWLPGRGGAGSSTITFYRVEPFIFVE